MALAATEYPANDRPHYDAGNWRIDDAWLRKMERFSQQVLETTRPFWPCLPEEMRVLDVGSGCGGLAIHLARRCATVVGIEPCRSRVTTAEQLQASYEQTNLCFRHQSVETLTDEACYDLIVLDNVLEHLPNQPLALANIVRALAPGGVLYILVPNKLWPIEVHYRLPLLSYLPLPLANTYLRLTGRGHDYTDASYAPTYWRLKSLLREQTALSFQFVLPANLSLAARGNSWLYRGGATAIRRCPALWAISKALLVVAKKGASS